MMSQRIRYLRVDGNGVLKSRRAFSLADGRQVFVELDTTAKKFTIKDGSSGEVVSSGGNTKNLSVLKIQAKKGLEELGVQFAEEKRNRQ